MGDAKHKGHLIRFPDQDWEDLGEAAKAAGSDRSTVIRGLVNWWLHRSLAHVPARPPEPEASLRKPPAAYTPAAPEPEASLRPTAGSVPFREPDPERPAPKTRPPREPSSGQCPPHPKARVIKGFCGACGRSVQND